MSKAVFTTKVGATYDDLPECHYHFPKSYLSRVQKTVGDWIIYYEPGKGGGRKSYYATARVVSIDKDKSRKDHYYAYVTDYLEFEKAIPFKMDSFYFESALQGDDGQTQRGIFQNSVRAISDTEYKLILQCGFGIVGERSTSQPTRDVAPHDEILIPDRQIIKQVVNRPFRDQAFSKQVKNVYENKCAFTGIKLINGGGRPEVQAAHIQPVEQKGPDSIRNGIALSGTVHWMFDRGLISIDEDYSILTDRSHIPKPIMSMFNDDCKILFPENPALRPHRQFIQYHQRNIFKG